MNPRTQPTRTQAAPVAMRPGPVEGLVFMSVGALVLGLAFLTQVDGYSPRDLAQRLLPGAPAMAESDSASVGL